MGYRKNTNPVVQNMSVGAEYVAEQISSLILQPVLRRFYCLIFAPSGISYYTVV